EYMTTIQLHAGKLWFATKASNWELAEYELDELKETMEAAKALNAEKNGVKISNVLDSVLQTQVAQLTESIKRKSPAEFQKSYDCGDSYSLFMTKPVTKISAMEYWPSKSLNTRSKRLSNTQAWVERFKENQIPVYTARLSSGTRSSKVCAFKAASF